MAAGGARAAGGQGAADRIPWNGLPIDVCLAARGISPGPARLWLYRGHHCQRRVPMGRRALRAAPRVGGRTSSFPGGPDVTHGTPGSLAAKRATTTIAIVMASIGDPVAVGIVTKLARPGGNITGQTFFNPELRAKRIELLKEVMPRLTRVAVILNADNPATGPEFQAMETTAQSLNVKLLPFRLRTSSELVGAFESMEQASVEAVETGDDPLAVGNVGAIVALAARGRLLTIGPEDVARAGGTMGYGVDF